MKGLEPTPKSGAALQGACVNIVLTLLKQFSRFSVHTITFFDFSVFKSAVIFAKSGINSL